MAKTKLALLGVGVAFANLMARLCKMALVYLIVTWILQLALQHSLPVYWSTLNFNLEYWNLFWLVFTIRSIRVLFRRWELDNA
jgi:hypothetical protein